MSELTRSEPPRFAGLKFYATMYLVAVKARTEYRVDFFVSALTAVLLQLASLSFYWIVFSQTDAVGAFDSGQVLYLTGMVAMVLGTSELLLNGIWQLPFYLMNGELDRLLVYPVRSLLFMLLSRPELHALGNFLTGAVLVLLSLQAADIPTLAYLLAPLWIACGAVVYTSMLVIFGAISFLAVGPWSNHYFIVFNLLNATRFPVSIYPAWLQVVLLLLFPIGAAIFLPAEWLWGHHSLWSATVAPLLAALLTALAASFVWEGSLRRYQSTGS